MLFHTQYNEYFGENVHMFNALDFLAELTQHIPPKGIQYIRRYGLYASRTKGKWNELPSVVERVPEGWKNSHAVVNTSANEAIQEIEVTDGSVKKAWARLLAKVYEGDPLICPKCGSDMKVIAAIQEYAEIRKILRHLSQVGRAPLILIFPNSIIDFFLTKLFLRERYI